jgi:hypothetical protein
MGRSSDIDHLKFRFFFCDYYIIVSHHIVERKGDYRQMTDRQMIERRIRQKEREVQNLEDKLREAKGYISALRDLIGMGNQPDKSTVELARDIIFERGHSVHITELLAAMGREITRENRVSLTGAISAYARRGEIFTREGPNRFGLLHAAPKSRPKASTEPPDNFGELSEAAPREKTKDDAGR